MLNSVYITMGNYVNQITKSSTRYLPTASSKPEISISSPFIKSPDPILTCFKLITFRSKYKGTSSKIGQTAPIGTPQTFSTSSAFANSQFTLSAVEGPNNLLTFLKSSRSQPRTTSAIKLLLVLITSVLTISSSSTPVFLT